MKSKKCRYSQEEELQIITTEKDYYKIKDFNINEIEYLKVELEIIKKDKFFKNFKFL